MLYDLFKKLSNRGHVNLEETHDQIEAIKKLHNKNLNTTVRKSIAKSRQAEQNFDKISEEMQSMANDITIRIAKATRNLQTL